MKKLLFLVALLFGLPCLAQEPLDSLLPAPSLESFRKVGDSRVWNFEIDKQNIGTLTSTVTGTKSVDGQDGYVIAQELKLDFRKAGTELTMHSEGEQYLSTTGSYLGCKIKLDVSGQASTIRIERDGDRLEAEVSSESGSSESAVPFPREGFGFELFYVDLMEIYFAMKGTAVAQTHSDTLYAVQSMLPVSLSALCADFRNQALFTNKYDSIFIINVTLPENYRLYMNRSHNMVKAEMPDRKLKIYQDYIGPVRRTGPQEPGFSFADLLRSLPVIPVYFGFAAIVVALLGWSGWKYRNCYMAFLGGMAIYLIVPLTLHPLQKLVVEHVVIPGAQKGESLYVLALLPALVAGLIFTAITVGSLYSLNRVPRDTSLSLASIGAFFGAGLAVADSIYLATTIPSGLLFSLMLLERAAFIILCTVIGSLIGRALERDTHALIQNLIGSFCLVMLFKYLPVLVQQRVVELKLMYILSLLISVIVLGIALILLARSSAKLKKHRTSGHAH
jgi:hypothetical protein